MHSSSHRHFANPFGEDATAGSDSAFPAAATLHAGRDLLDSIVRQTWRPDIGLLDCGEGLRGTDLYTGYGGVAAALLRRALLLREPEALKRATAMLDACIKMEQDAAAAHKARGRAPQLDVTMIMGLPGLWALRAVAAHAAGDAAARDTAIATIRAFAAAGYVHGPGAVARKLPCEMLYGRAGFLYACAFVNAHCSSAGSSASAAASSSSGGAGTGAGSSLPIPESVTAPIIAEVIDLGRKGSSERAAALAESGSSSAGRRGGHHGVAVPPLFYTWHGSPYLGAAHGLAGICHALLHFPLDAEARADVLGSLRYLLAVRYPSGNMPSSDDGRERSPETDKLVHWCHGATGLALTMARAWEVTHDPDFAVAAVEAAEVVWQRGLLTKLSLCHGVAGNAYAFLAVRRMALHIASLAAGTGAAGSGGLGVAGGAAGSGSSGSADAGTTAAEWTSLAELSLRRARCFAHFLVFGPPPHRSAGSARGGAGVGHAGASLAGASAGSSAAASATAAAQAVPESAPTEQYWERLVTAGEMHGGDRHLSLYEGAAGVAWALMDIGLSLSDRHGDAVTLPPSFPGYEL